MYIHTIHDAFHKCKKDRVLAPQTPQVNAMAPEQVAQGTWRWGCLDVRPAARSAGPLLRGPTPPKCPPRSGNPVKAPMF